MYDDVTLQKGPGRTVGVRTFRRTQDPPGEEGTRTPDVSGSGPTPTPDGPLPPRVLKSTVVPVLSVEC